MYTMLFLDHSSSSEEALGLAAQRHIAFRESERRTYWQIKYVPNVNHGEIPREVPVE